jgi:uncharacterized protein (TIGR03118 family)
VPRLEVLEDRTVPSGYQQINLVAEVPGVAPHTDPNLDGWGMVATPNGYMVADPPLGVATFYDANGKVLPQVVTIPPAPNQPLGPAGQPRGAEYNPTSEFVISENGRSAPALVLFGTRDGTISGWNPAVDADHAIIMVDNSAKLSTAVNHAMYSSLHIAQNSKGQTVLYAADRGHNEVDMFDGQFHFLGFFTNPSVKLSSPGHPGAWQVEDAPNGNLFVLYTLETGAFQPYGGIVDIFDTDGKLLTPNHFTANGLGGGPLEAPWGITQAPADFGQFSNDILIGNDGGPGYIDAFDPVTGEYLGHLTHPDGTPIAIPGLWYLTFGGGTPQTGLAKHLYFVAGPSLEHTFGQGLFGRIIAAGQGDEPGSNDNGAAATEAPASMMQSTGPAQMPAPQTEGLSQSGGFQGTSVASPASSLQPAATDISSSSTGNSETIDDVLDGLILGIANSLDNPLVKKRL